MNPGASNPRSELSGAIDAVAHSREPRVLMFSQRGLDGLLSRCVSYEFEDVIRGIDDVTLVAPGRPPLFQWRTRLSHRLAMRLPITLNPGLDRTEVDKDYDLFLAVVAFPQDLSTLQAMPGWRRRSRCAICVIEELWPGQLRHFSGYAKLLEQFDHVLLYCNFTVNALRTAMATDCRYLPPGVDAIRFCPYPDPAPRSVYVYSIGRRSPVIHEELLRHCGRERLWYVHDTINIHEAKRTDNPLSHRNLVANTTKRSRYFVANIGKIERRCETGGHQEVGFRFFEGAAAGAVMFGEPPDTDVFQSLFDWPDSVLRVPYDSSNARAILADLDSQPARVSRIRRDNVVNSLLRHDWLYRWRTLLDLAGLDPTPAFHQRENRLQQLADLARAQPEPD